MRPYMVREPMRPEHLFLVEASAAAMEAGVLRTVAVAIERVLDSFVGGEEEVGWSGGWFLWMWHRIEVDWSGSWVQWGFVWVGSPVGEVGRKRDCVRMVVV